MAIHAESVALDLETQLAIAIGEERVAPLLDLAWLLRRRDASRSVTLAEEAVRRLESDGGHGEARALAILALGLLHAGQPEQAAIRADEAQNVCAEGADPSARALICHARARAKLRQSSYREARDLLRHALASAWIEAVAPGERSLLQRDLGEAEFFLGDAHAATLCFEDLSHLALESGDTCMLARAHLSLAALHDALENSERSERSARAGLECAYVSRHLPLLAHALRLLAAAAGRRKEHATAIDFLERAQRIEGEAAGPAERAATLQALGYEYLSLKMPDEARLFVEQALALWREVGDERAASSALHCLGQVEGLAGDPNRALESFEEAMRIRREGDVNASLALMLGALGEQRLEAGDSAGARVTFEEQVTLGEQTDQHEAMVSGHLGLARVEAAAGDLGAARSALGKAQVVAECLHESEFLSEYHRRAAEVLSACGQHEAANVHLREQLRLAAVTSKDLAESRQRLARRLSTVYDIGACAMFVVRVGDLRILEVNVRFEEVFGWNAAGAVGQTVGSLELWTVPPDLATYAQELAGGVRDMPIAGRDRAGCGLEMRLSTGQIIFDGVPCLQIVIQGGTSAGATGSGGSPDHVTGRTKQPY